MVHRKNLFTGQILYFRHAPPTTALDSASDTVSRWSKNDQGQRVHSEHQRVTRPWFFAQDGGHYVQCKYGSKPLPLNKDGNAVFVKSLTEIPSVLRAFYASAAAGEFDSAIADAAKRPARA